MKKPILLLLVALSLFFYFLRTPTKASLHLPHLRDFTKVTTSNSSRGPAPVTELDPLMICLETKTLGAPTLTGILEHLTDREKPSATRVIRKSIHFRNDDGQERRLLFTLKANGQFEKTLFSVDAEGIPEPINETVTDADADADVVSDVSYEERDEEWRFAEDRRFFISYVGNTVIEFTARLSATRVLSCVDGADSPVCHCTATSTLESSSV